MSSSPDDRVFELAANLFSLLSAPTRLRIVCALIEGEKNVTELIERVSVSQPNMFQHLGTLYRGVVLGRRRTGSQVFYRVDHVQVRGLCHALRAGTEYSPAAKKGASPRDTSDLRHSSQEPL